MPLQYKIQYAYQHDQVKLSQIVAIRTNYFWSKSEYWVYLLFPPSLLLHFFLLTLYIGNVYTAQFHEKNRPTPISSNQ